MILKDSSLIFETKGSDKVSHLLPRLSREKTVNVNSREFDIALDDD